MTYSEDLMNTTALDTTTYLADAPNYPVFFGITLSPILMGGIAAIIGVGASSYLAYSNLMPMFEANKELQAKVDNVQQQIKERKDNDKKIVESEVKLKEVTAQKETVLSLFANEQKLDTLLVDLNKLVSSRQGELQKFTPDVLNTGNITDSSLGSALNNKLRRKSTDISVQGGFDQIQSILRTVERMDRLLIVQNFKADLQPTTTNTVAGSIPNLTPKITTTLKLQAIIPLTTAEIAAAAPPPSPSASPAASASAPAKK
jgi:type IV pilus assembly protein PilO